MSNEANNGKPANGATQEEAGRQEQATLPTPTPTKKLGWKRIATYAGVGVVVAAGAAVGVMFLRKPSAAKAVGDVAQAAAEAVSPSA
jgi:hypothetical protein